MHDAKFSELIMDVPLEVVKGAYLSIDAKLEQISAYVGSWLKYQTLWDLTLEEVVATLGPNVPSWLKTMEDLKAAGNLMGKSTTEQRFGPVVISFREVKEVVSSRFAFWQGGLRDEFGKQLSESIVSLRRELAAARERVERADIDRCDKAEIIQAVTVIQEERGKKASYQARVEEDIESENLLKKLKYEFPSKYEKAGNLKTEFEAFSSILESNGATMDRQKPLLEVILLYNFVFHWPDFMC